MTTEWVDITPTTHLLASIRASKGPYYLLFAEACDNSFDAAASRIEIVCNAHGLRISDNGIGITKDRELAIFTLGKHGGMGSTELGRYGIGITDRAASAGDLFVVKSVSVDGTMFGKISWPDIPRTAEWRMPKPVWDLERTTPTGVSLQISQLARVPSDAENRRSTQELSQIYRPALVAGKQIVFNGDAVPILREPKLDALVDARVSVSDTKGAHVRAGIIMELKPQMHEVYVSFGFRNVKMKSNFACEGFSGKRMYAAVSLFGKWGLSRFKDKIDDDDLDRLEDKLHEVIRPILERLRTESMTAELGEITGILNDMLPPELAAARPERKQQLGREGSRPGRQGKHEKEDTSGPARVKKPPRSQLRIDFEDGDEEYGIGCFKEGRPSVVQLSKDNPYIAGLIRDRNVGAESALPSLYAAAISIYDEWARRQGDLRQGELFDQADFGVRMARFLRKNVAYEQAA